MIAFEPATNAQAWSTQIECINGDTNTPYPFEDEGYAIELELRDQRNTLMVTASTLDGRITYTPTGFAIEVPQAVMQALRPATYAVYGRATSSGNEPVQIINTTIAVQEGGFR
jgi:hypothetical protein